MTEQEPRSAFEIPGFLEGTVQIHLREGAARYFIKDTEIFYIVPDAPIGKTGYGVNFFLRKIWRPVSTKGIE